MRVLPSAWHRSAHQIQLDLGNVKESWAQEFIYGWTENQLKLMFLLGELWLIVRHFRHPVTWHVPPMPERSDFNLTIRYIWSSVSPKMETSTFDIGYECYYFNLHAHIKLAFEQGNRNIRIERWNAKPHLRS